MALKVFVINPGSTSTKIAVFNGSNCEFTNVLNHNSEELKAFLTSTDQLEYRFELIMNIINQEGINLNSIDAFVGRGGLLKPIKGGTYIVGREMLEDLS